MASIANALEMHQKGSCIEAVLLRCIERTRTGHRALLVLQGQDWDFIAHTFWLKHGVAMLFDSLYLADGITLAYNSGVCSTSINVHCFVKPVLAGHDYTKLEWQQQQR